MLMKEAVVYVDSREGAMAESGDVILSGVSPLLYFEHPGVCTCVPDSFIFSGGGVCRTWRCGKRGEACPQREDDGVQIAR